MMVGLKLILIISIPIVIIMVMHQLMLVKPTNVLPIIKTIGEIENCPGYGHIQCECPFASTECPDSWSCEDIYYITSDAMAYWDSNGDGQIDYNDGWSQDDIDAINAYCDYDGNGATDSCEAHDCIVAYENSWRAENCPGYPEIYCDCPF